MSEKDPQPVIDVGPEGALVVAHGVLPPELPIFPLMERPMFPGITVPLQLREEQWVAINFALASSSEMIGLVLLKDPAAGLVSANLHDVGVVAKVIRAVGDDESATHILVHGIHRFRVLDTRLTDDVLVARVRYNEPKDHTGDDEMKAGEVAIKDLRQGRELAAEIGADRKKWIEEQPAQFTATRAELVDAVKRVLARYSIG